MSLKSTEKAIESQHDNIIAWFNKGIILYHLKRYKETILSMKKVTELRSDYKDIWFYLASLYSIEGEKDNAISSLRMAIEISPAIKKSVIMIRILKTYGTMKILRNW